MAGLKKVLLKELAAAGWSGRFDPDAQKALIEHMAQSNGDVQAIYQVLDVFKNNHMATTGRVDEQTVLEAIAKLQGRSSIQDFFEVINVYDVPKPLWDITTNKMFADKRALSAFATAKLREIGTLAGLINQRVIVMGTISQLEDGVFYLQDSKGAVRLDLAKAQTTTGIFTENCVVVAEGTMKNDGIFHADALGFPPCEVRDQLPGYIKKLNLFGGKALSAEELMNLELEEGDHSEDRIVVLANVWLDKQEVMDGLNTIFRGFQEAGAVPALFVLMGNFHSGSGQAAALHISAMRNNFAALARLIEQYPDVKDQATFVFVPGPEDLGPGRMLPQPPLPKMFTQELQAALPKAIFTSNPCRIRYCSKEMVFFRYDITKQLRWRSLMPGSETAESPEELFQRVALTLLQQAHVCPLPLVAQPVYWQYDHGLHLQPLPHMLVLADTTSQAEFKHMGCHCVNPGVFSQGMFGALLPCQSKFEPCEVPDDNEDDMEEMDDLMRDQ